MNHFREKLCLLHHWKGISWSMVNMMLEQDPSLAFLKEFTVCELKNHYFLQKLPTSLKDLPKAEIISLLQKYKQEQIHYFTYFDDEYPQLLKEIYQPPWVIFAKGNLSILQNNKKLAVVGSREFSTYGKMAIQALFPPLIEHDFVIVSGLAKGIDAQSHETAINFGGSTIAVIAGGFYHIYPKENQKLADIMMSSQLLLSEYPPDTKPEKWHFPTRNRIISGICRGTLIIEAKKKSGSLITANFSVNEGREVFALPGNIFSANSVGTNELIQQGAKLVLSAKDILEEFIY